MPDKLDIFQQFAFCGTGSRGHDTEISTAGGLSGSGCIGSPQPATLPGTAAAVQKSSQPNVMPTCPSPAEHTANVQIDFVQQIKAMPSEAPLGHSRGRYSVPQHTEATSVECTLREAEASTVQAEPDAACRLQLATDEDIFTRCVYRGPMSSDLKGDATLHMLKRKRAPSNSSATERLCESPTAMHAPDLHAEATPDKLSPSQHAPEATPHKELEAVTPCVDSNPLDHCFSEFAFHSSSSGQPAAKVPSGDEATTPNWIEREVGEACERAKVVPVTKPATVKRRRVFAKRVPARLMEPDHPAFNDAIEMGLGTAFRNLASREEIVNSGLPMDTLLEALRDAGGLVNKAKMALLGM